MSRFDNKQRKRTISVTTAEKQALEDVAYWHSKTAAERLDMVELLRLEAGKFLYEYPARLRRVIEVVRS